MTPTSNGPNMDPILEKVLVIPNNVPAKFGAKSKWFIRKPVKTPLLIPIVTVNKTIAPVIEVLNKYKKINDKAPPQ